MTDDPADGSAFTSDPIFRRYLDILIAEEGVVGHSMPAAPSVSEMRRRASEEEKENIWGLGPVSGLTIIFGLSGLLWFTLTQCLMPS